MAARPRPGDLPRGRVCRTPESVDDAASTDGGITGSPATNTSLGSTCSPSWESQTLAIDDPEQAKLRASRKGNQPNQPEIFTRLYDEAQRLKQVRANKLEQHLAAVKLQSAKNQAKQANWEQVAQRLHDEHRERLKKQKARMDEKIRREEEEIEALTARTEYRAGQAEKIAERLHDQEMQKRKAKALVEQRHEEQEKLQASKKVSSNPQTLERLYNEHAQKQQLMNKRREEKEKQEEDMLTTTSVHRCRSADGKIFDRLYADGLVKRKNMEKLRQSDTLVSPIRRTFSPGAEPRISSSLLSPTAASKGKLAARPTPTADASLPAFTTSLKAGSPLEQPFAPAPRKRLGTKAKEKRKEQDASGLDELGIMDEEGEDAAEDADEVVYDEGAEEEAWEEGAEEEVAEEGDEAVAEEADEAAAAGAFEEEEDCW